MLHGHGDDRYLYADTAIKADFSSNVGFNGVSGALMQHLNNRLEVVSRYPEPDAGSLAKAIAQKYEVEAGQVLVTNGGTEAFYLIGQSFGGKSATIPVPTFAEYEDVCLINRVKTRFIPWEYLLQEPVFETGLVFICNPNNPTGKYIPFEIIGEFLVRHPDTTFILDEAYLDFVPGAYSSKHWLKEFDNLILVGSMTKLFTIPGLRVGYLMASPPLLENLKQFKMPWSVNALALEAGHFIVDHHEKLKPDTFHQVELSQELRHQLEPIKNIVIHYSDTHYFLIELQKGDAASLKDFLLRHYGLLVRDASNFRSLDQKFVRIAAQGASDNQLLVEAMQAWAQS